MADVTRTVETLFKVGGIASAQRALGSMAGAAQNAARSLSGLAAPLTAMLSVAGVGMAARSMMEMQSAAEGMRNSIVGTMVSMGAVGSFEEGMSESARLMDQINRDAAALPGSAEDYIAAFRTALPAAMNAGFGSMDEIANFTNHMTAIAASNQEDAQQAGMDLMRILQGHAGAEVRLWQTIAGQQHISAEAFNHMNVQQRHEHLLAFMRSYQPLLDRMGDTWDAISGTFTQYATQMTRAATAPLFEAAKHALSSINDLLGQNQERIQDIGRNISEQIVGGFNRAVHMAGELHSRFESMREGAGRVAGFASQHLGSMAAVAGRVALGPGGGMLVSSVTALLRDHTEELVGIFDRMTTVGSGLMDSLRPLWSMSEQLSTSFASMVANALPGVMSGVESLGQGLQQGIAAAMPALQGLTDTVQTVVGPIGERFGALASIVGGALSPAFSLAGQALGGLASAVSSVVLNLDTWVSRLGDWISRATGGRVSGETVSTAVQDALTSMVTLGLVDSAHDRLLNNQATSIEQALSGRNRSVNREAKPSDTTELGGMGDASRGFHQMVDSFGNAITATARHAMRNAAHATPQARGGAHTVQDFRYSRFDITQKFTEGYDPDRIAVAFARDIAGSADRRLSGQLEPQHAVVP